MHAAFSNIKGVRVVYGAVNESGREPRQKTAERALAAVVAAWPQTDPSVATEQSRHTVARHKYRGDLYISYPLLYFIQS